MSNTLALAKRILQQFSHDPRTVVLFIVAPVLALWLFSVMLGSPAYVPKIVGVDLPANVVQAIEDEDVSFVETGAAEARDLLANRQIDAVVSLEGDLLAVEVEGADASKTGAVMAVMQAALQQMGAGERAQALLEASRLLGSGTAHIEDKLTVTGIEVSYLHGSEDWNYFDFFGPVFIGIFIFVFVFLTSGMSLVTERTGGTMERLLATPIKPHELVCGYMLGFGIVSLVQAALGLWASITLIGFPTEGNLLFVIAITFSMALVSLTLGLLVSGLAKTAFQVIQFMVILVVPQILLSGIFDLSQAPEWMQVLSACLPVSHGAAALRDVMLRGADLSQIALDVGILWGFIVAFFVAATASFARRQTR
jgi:ABC-2 type transport system permease protein